MLRRGDVVDVRVRTLDPAGPSFTAELDQPPALEGAVLAIDNKTGENIQALIPSNGGLLFFDTMVIPADAARPGNAHRFINFMLRPEIAASNTNKVFYPNPVPESKKHIRAEVANNPTVFLPAAEMAKMVPPDALNNDLRRLMTRTYTSFKTGL